MDRPVSSFDPQVSGFLAFLGAQLHSHLHRNPIGVMESLEPEQIIGKLWDSQRPFPNDGSTRTGVFTGVRPCLRINLWDSKRPTGSHMKINRKCTIGEGIENVKKLYAYSPIL